jgi:hypothetical protein
MKREGCPEDVAVVCILQLGKFLNLTCAQKWIVSVIDSVFFCPEMNNEKFQPELTHQSEVEFWCVEYEISALYTNTRRRK